MTKWIMALTVATALTGVAHATPSYTVSRDAAANGLVGPAGLAGSFYHAGGGSTNFLIGTTLATEKATLRTGTFTATSLNYNGADTSTITSFLGNDGASYKGRVAPASFDMSDGILDMAGFLYVSAPGTYTYSMSHDDSAQLSIGGQTVISANCCGTDTVNVLFQSAGYYAIDAIYSNSEYNNGTGGASFSLLQNNAVLTAANLVQGVPEPASLAVLGIGLAGTVAARRRARRAHAASA